MPDASAGTPEFSDTARMETTAAAFAALQAGRTFQQAAIRLDAPALAPMLSVLTLSGPRAGTLGDPGEPVDNAEPISIWLPADMATGRSAAPGSFAEVVTTQRSPVIVTDAAPPMQVVLGAQAGNVFAEPVPAPTPTPTPEQRGETAGNLVARTFSKALCLVGAVGLFAHAAFAGKSRQNDARDEATEKKQ